LKQKSYIITKDISIKNKRKNGVTLCDTNIPDDSRYIYMTKDMCIIRFANVFGTFTCDI